MALLITHRKDGMKMKSRETGTKNGCDWQVLPYSCTSSGVIKLEFLSSRNPEGRIRLFTLLSGTQASKPSSVLLFS
ncbi:hypothetical protein CHARACLAT_006199 [Characodon lateralis]|uniref:Uncharacterized protein n=1 Tax=Characodon lateralis TaxID=208331 RepID=A0ABU7DRX7_9TELE|nr:hypothetical protein [Characodon lateralis]